MNKSKVNIVEYNGQLYRVAKMNETSSGLQLLLRPVEVKYIKARDLAAEEIERILDECLGKENYD